MRVFALLFFCLMVPAAAAPPSLDSLFAALKKAATPEDAQPLERRILDRFAHSGSDSLDLLLSRADQAFRAGDKAAASRLLQAVTDIEPKFAEGWRARALFSAQVGDDRAAMACLQKVVALNPRHFAAMTELGGMLEAYGDRPGALGLYRKALEIDPQFENLQRKVDALTRDVEGQGI